MSQTPPPRQQCKCQNCGSGCSGKHKTEPKPEKPLGFFAARPWIWIAIGYLTMVGALSTMVVIAVKHQDRDVRVNMHGH